MTALDNIRRDLASAHYLEFSPVPFAGAVHNFDRTLRQRFEAREYTGPYYMSPAKPGGGRGFYQASKGLACDKHGSFFDLRLELANDHLPRSSITGYFTDEFCDQTLTPIIARLPHGRGYLAGWTMGGGMAASLELDLYSDAETAAHAAHDIAERDAEKEREYQERESERLRQEEDEQEEDE